MISLNHEDASIRSILDICVDLPCYQYYLNINPRVTKENITARRNVISTSDQTYNSRYSSMIGFTYCDSLYDNCLIESRRAIITRWRLSNHKLHIETGRYKRPKTPRNERLCNNCIQIEDEDHTIFHCTSYDIIRAKYTNLLSKYTTVKNILNPRDTQDAYRIGSFLLELEAHQAKINGDIT